MDFRESVRVIWAGEVSGVVARAVNLSPAGILIDAPTPTPCPVGSDVLCDVTLPRGPRLLRGRVAHRRVLASQKVGMGIEFIDLSPREVAELRDIVGESEERPQRVKVRFQGTNQIVRARAYATPAGFRLATALPFLKAATEVDIALSPDERANARGWVSGVSLDRSHADGVPRLLIDVEVSGSPARDFVPSEAKTPVVESLAGASEYVWQPEELGALRELPAASLDAPVHALASGESSEDVTPPVPGPAFPYAADFVPTVASLGAPLPEIADGPASGPAGLSESDLTEIIPLAPPVERRGWSAFGVGMLVGVGLLAVLALVLLRRPGAPQVAAAPAPSSPPAVVAAPAPVPAPAVVAPTPPAAPVPTPAVAAPAVEPAAEVDAEPIAAAPAEFFVGLKGSLAGARRYPLANPDGIAFNLPHARPTMKMGSYPNPAPGLRSVWVRPLPGGGTHLRFHFQSATTAPRVELYEDGVHSFAR